MPQISARALDGQDALKDGHVPSAMADGFVPAGCRKAVGLSAVRPDGCVSSIQSPFTKEGAVVFIAKT